MLVVATLPLFSCFPVKDFGAYWDKAGTDKRLAGSWEISKAELLRLKKHETPPSLWVSASPRGLSKEAAHTRYQLRAGKLPIRSKP